MSKQYINGQLMYDTDYSTSEVKTGATWIDGKPIYTKVITGTSASGDTDINTTSLNIETLVDIRTAVKIANGRTIYGNYYTGSADTLMVLTYEASQIRLRAGTTGVFGSYRIIIWYTKTTD